MKIFKTLLLMILFSSMFIACDEDNKAIQTESTTTQKITGKWQLVLSKKNGDPILEIEKECEQNNDTIVNDSYQEEVFLYLHNDNTVTGHTGMFKLFGKIENNKMTLDVYEPNNGKYNAQTDISSMIKISTFTVDFSNSYEFKGSGVYLDVDPMSSVGMTDDEYYVFGRKIDDMSKIGGGENTLGLAGELCNIGNTILSASIDIISEGTVQPMDGCNAHKSGGGYYIFGNQGPGNLKPVSTQTVYYPYEWSACGVRTYNFDISIGGKIHSTDKILEYMGKISNWTKIFGYTDLDTVKNAIEACEKASDGFAIAGAYSTYSGNVSLYLLTANGNLMAFTQLEPIIRLMQRFPFSNGDDGNTTDNPPSVYAGKIVHDSFKLRRSPAFACNTPVVFFYLFGTNSCTFN